GSRAAPPAGEHHRGEQQGPQLAVAGAVRAHVHAAGAAALVGRTRLLERERNRGSALPFAAGAARALARGLAAAAVRALLPLRADRALARRVAALAGERVAPRAVGAGDAGALARHAGRASVGGGIARLALRALGIAGGCAAALDALLALRTAD